MYAQTCKKFISFMTGAAKTRLTLIMLIRKHSYRLHQLKRNNNGQSKLSDEWNRHKMIVLEDFLSNGMPQEIVNVIFAKMDI